MTDNRHFLKTNITREANTFDGFREFPAVAGPQLDNWLGASKVHVVSALEWRWPKSWPVGPRVLNDSMFFWFASGCGSAWCRDPTHTFSIAAGDLMLIPQGVEHAIVGCGESEPHVFAVHFYSQLFGSINLLDILGFPVHVPNRADAPYGDICKRLVREYAVKAPGHAVAMAADLWQLLHYILRTETSRFTPLATVGCESELPRLLPVLQWIDDHLESHELTVGDLADQVYLSETHFRRLFHKVFGTSPVQFIRQRRVDRACALLRSTELPIKQIAQKCGFAEDAFFSRVFHRFAGISPAAYRKLDLV